MTSLGRSTPMRSRKTIHNFLFDEQFDSLPAMLINFGHQCVTDHSYCFHGLARGNRPIVIWQHCLAGQGELAMGKQRYAVLPGQSMLLMIPEDHCYYLPKQSDGWEFLLRLCAVRGLSGCWASIAGNTGSCCGRRHSLRR